MTKLLISHVETMAYEYLFILQIDLFLVLVHTSLKKKNKPTVHKEKKQQEEKNLIIISFSCTLLSENCLLCKYNTFKFIWQYLLITIIAAR